MAAVLVLNTPDDGRLRPKRVERLCRNKSCTVLHQVGVSFDLYYDARKHKIKMAVHYLPVRLCLTLMLHMLRVLENGVLIKEFGHMKVMITAGHWR